MLFVLTATHPPDQCPTSNSKIRNQFKASSTELPRVAKKLGVKLIAGPLILGSEHESITIVEADQVKSVRDFTVQTGLVQWNSIRISLAITMEEGQKDVEDLKPLYLLPFSASRYLPTLANRRASPRSASSSQ